MQMLPPALRIIEFCLSDKIQAISLFEPGRLFIPVTISNGTVLFVIKLLYNIPMIQVKSTYFFFDNFNNLTNGIIKINKQQNIKT